jgi:general stress protein 26
MRQYEIVRDRMHEMARRNQRYMTAYNDAEPDNDLWMFCRALEDISNGNSPDLEKML